MLEGQNLSPFQIRHQGVPCYPEGYFRFNLWSLGCWLRVLGLGVFGKTSHNIFPAKGLQIQHVSTAKHIFVADVKHAASVLFL